MNTENQQSARIAQRVTLIGMLLDIALGIFKIIVGISAFSHALVADGIHSLSDAVTDIFVLAITRVSYSAPDANHPYGHARFETLGTVVLGSFLIAVAITLAWNYSVLFFANEQPATPAWPALVIAFISIISKEWIYQYTKKAGEKLRSNLLIANAWHSRTDAFSSVIVLIGIAASMLGAPWVDKFAAIIVAIIIGKIGWKLVWDSLKELVDTGLDPQETDTIKGMVQAIEGVDGVHAIRTRRMGQDVFVDLHIRVNPCISVSEGHHIGEWVARELLTKSPSISDVIYHIDTQDDIPLKQRLEEPLLPLRHEVIEQLSSCWHELPQPERITLHYLNNKIDVDLYITQSSDSLIPLEQYRQSILANASRTPWLGTVHLWSHH